MGWEEQDMGVLISPRRRGKAVFLLVGVYGVACSRVDGKRGDNNAERTEFAILQFSSDGDGFLGVG